MNRGKATEGIQAFLLTAVTRTRSRFQLSADHGVLSRSQDHWSPTVRPDIIPLGHLTSIQNLMSSASILAAIAAILGPIATSRQTRQVKVGLLSRCPTGRSRQAERQPQSNAWLIFKVSGSTCVSATPGILACAFVLFDAHKRHGGESIFAVCDGGRHYAELTRHSAMFIESIDAADYDNPPLRSPWYTVNARTECRYQTRSQQQVMAPRDRRGNGGSRMRVVGCRAVIRRKSLPSDQDSSKLIVRVLLRFHIWCSLLPRVMSLYPC